MSKFQAGQMVRVIDNRSYRDIVIDKNNDSYIKPGTTATITQVILQNNEIYYAIQNSIYMILESDLEAVEESSCTPSCTPKSPSRTQQERIANLKTILTDLLNDTSELQGRNGKSAMDAAVDRVESLYEEELFEGDWL